MTIADYVVHDVEAIQTRHRKFIAEITKNLAPPHSEELNYQGATVAKSKDGLTHGETVQTIY